MDQLPLFPELPVLPYVEALRDIDEIAQGFQNDRGVQLIVEFQGCKQLQAACAAFIKAAGHAGTERYYRGFATRGEVALIEPPPGSLPPLI